MTSSKRPPGSRTERLRQAVAEADDGKRRLAALLALARHFAEVSDGANGLETARAARALALELEDWQAVSHALSSASVSQYHRSDYAGALATAVDAWDSARRASSTLAIAESLYAISLALHALGEAEDGLRVVAKGLAITASSPELREVRVRLVQVKGLLSYREDTIAQTEALCAEAVELARGFSTLLLELGHGNWGLALLRTAERRIERGEPAGDLLARSREQLELALQHASSRDDVIRVADRLSALGQVAFVAGRLEEAEPMLEEALRRSLELDYVRSTVMSARYLARLYLGRGDFARAVEILRLADAKARRGVSLDGRPAVKTLLAEALAKAGRSHEAERAREAALELRNAADEQRRRAAVEARRLAARVLAELGPG
jgi:tetratricopeptide (TPR) repeat protein